jgi:tRNA modification GTPase
VPSPRIQPHGAPTPPRSFLPGRPAGENSRATLISISALYGSGIESLKKAIRTVVLNGRLESSSELILSNLRHKRAVEAAQEALSQALASVEANLSWEFITPDLQRSLEALGEIVGETTSEEVLDRIFAQFCIGK